MPHESPFHDVHMKNNAVMTERDGWLLPEHYGDPDAEYAACRERLAVIDTSFRTRIRISGSDAADVLGETPPAGRQCWIQYGDQTIQVQNHDSGGYLVLDSPEGRQELLQSLLDRADDRSAKVVDETFKTAMVTLLGPAAVEVLAEKLPLENVSLNPDDVTVQKVFFMKLVLAVNDGRPVPGASLILPAGMAGMGWQMLEKYGERYGITLVGITAWRRLQEECSAPA